MVYLWILKVTGLGKICGQSYGVITVLKKLKMVSRDEKISLSESNTILQQATIDPEQAKNYL